MRRSLSRFTAAFAVLGLLLAACGDDDDDAATTTTEADGGDEDGADVEAWCAMGDELDALEEFPSNEQIEEYADAAPDEIADTVREAADLYTAAETDEEKQALFGDEEFSALGEEIESYEEDNCPPSEDEEANQALDPSATRVDVTATEYEFDAPTEVEAGLNGFVLTNAGEEEHELALVKLNEGATLAQALEAQATGGDPSEFIEDLDVGRTDAAPGEEAFLNVELDAGTYGMVCFVPAPDGEPHAAKGMVLEFTVA